MRFPSQVFAPIPANCSRHAIETFAEGVAERFGFVPDQDAAESPQMWGKVRFHRIHDLIKKIGGHVDFEYVPPDELHTSQSLIVFSEERFEIALLGRYRLEEREQTWILAQELGHHSGRKPKFATSWSSPMRCIASAAARAIIFSASLRTASST